MFWRIVFLFSFCLYPLAFAKSERAGKYEVSLRLPEDGLYAGEETEIEFRVVDTSQVDPVLGPTPIVRALIKVVIDMPSMPGMPKYEEVAHPEGIPGEYGVHPTFPHGGEYVMHLAVNPPVGEAFEMKFPLQVLDADGSGKRKPKPRPFRFELTANPKRPKPGEPADLEFRVRPRDNPKEIVKNFEIVHEKLLHLLIVRDDLTHFGHEHPDIGPDGAFRLRYTFPAGGDYHLFGDFAPRGGGSQVMMVKIRVQGKDAGKFDLSKAERSLVRKVEGVVVELSDGSLPIKKTTGVTFHLRDAATGQAVTDLEPYLGAMGHLILIHQDGVTFVHSHPDERLPDVGRNGSVPFLVRFPKPGLYRGWSQFQRRGNILTSDFVVEASEGSGQ
jgi:hypothetical protein